MILPDMEKLQSPFKREQKEINGSKYYVVTPEVDLDYLWVLQDTEVYAMEKLDGTNVSIHIEDDEVKQIQNRRNVVFEKGSWSKDSNMIKLAIENSSEHIKELGDGQHFGECIGIGVQKNPMDIPDKKWIPFNTYGKLNLVYDEWKDIPKDFESISNFMRNIKSKFYAINHEGQEEYSEGIVLYRPSTGDRSKLRRDMFDWWIEDNPGVINKHVNIYNKAPKKKPPTGMQGEFSIISKKFKQNLISKEDFEAEKKLILAKYNIK